MFACVVAGLYGCAPLDLGAPPIVVGAVPSEGAVEVSRRTSIALAFSEPLSPRSVHRGTVSLWSGPTQIGVSVAPDPVLPGIRVAPLRGFVLDPLVEYELRVDGVWDLDGDEAAPYVGRFSTGSVTTPEEPREFSSADVYSMFERRCVECHGPSDPLDLSSPEGVRRTAIGVTAGGRPLRVPERGLAGLEIISVLGGVGRPGYSYLLYAVARDVHVLGEPMPPGEALSQGEIELLTRWVEAGAPAE